MKTQVAKAKEITRDWSLVDVSNKVLGRAATQIANVLRGKTKPSFSPSVDTGDFVIVVNVEKLVLTGNKLADKVYYSHSGYPGGIKSINAANLLEKDAAELLRKAVKGMLPKNKLASQMLKKLKIYVGSEHPHSAQQPKVMNI